MMCRTTVIIEQIASPIRRHRKQRETLIGLGLNRIGRIKELLDTPETRGMIAKVAHLERVIHRKTELDSFVEDVSAEYREAITTRIVRGDHLWAQFEEAVDACRADPKGDDRQLTERVNEIAVAKVLLDDRTITGTITYEPDFLPDGRRIDFVVDRGQDNLYVEVKIVRPQTIDTDKAWEKFLEREKNHPERTAKLKPIIKMVREETKSYGIKRTPKPGVEEITEILAFERLAEIMRLVKPGCGQHSSLRAW